MVVVCVGCKGEGLAKVVDQDTHPKPSPPANVPTLASTTCCYSPLALSLLSANCHNQLKPSCRCSPPLPSPALFTTTTPPNKQNYEHHAIVKFLESIGASFGACQNACTSCDETVYTLMIRTDDDKLLDTSIGVLSEFAARIR